MDNVPTCALRARWGYLYKYKYKRYLLTSEVDPLAVVGELLEDVVLLYLVRGEVGRHVDKGGQAPRRQTCQAQHLALISCRSRFKSAQRSKVCSSQDFKL
jgi:hypothetical protein